MFAHEDQTWGDLKESHLKDKIYCPGSRLSGTSTKSLIAHSCGFFGFFQRLTLAHSEPGGVVPIVVVLMGYAVHLSGLKFLGKGLK